MRPLSMVLEILGWVVVTGTTALHAETYYVSPDGNDQNPGTEQQPFQTFPQADAALQPGDTVIVKDGHYDVGPGGFVTRKSGTKEQPLTWQAEHVGQVFVTNRQEVTGFASAEGRTFRARLAEQPLFLLADEDMLFPRREGEDAVGPKWQPGMWRYADGTLTVWLWDSETTSWQRGRVFSM